MTVENITVPGGDLEERRVKALEDQATAMLRQAAASEKIAAAQSQPLPGSAPSTYGPKDRYESMVRTCVSGRVAADVEGFLKFAEELLDGIDRKFPQDPQQGA